MHAWHDEIESATTVDEAVASVKRYLGSIPAADLAELSRYCRPSRIKADEDVDDLTFKLSQWQHRPAATHCDDALLNAMFDFVLHASLRISQLNRLRAIGRTTLASRPQMAQMS
jgi:hypothetical protein